MGSDQHTQVGFKVKHMMFTTISGKFSKFDDD
jgi:polyisoprenoid-binding protein YceI